MTLKHFTVALSKMGVRAEPTIIESLFQSLVKGSKLLTYKIFFGTLFSEKNAQNFRLSVSTVKYGGVLETIKRLLAQMELGPDTLLGALHNHDANGVDITFRDFCLSLEECNVHLTREDARRAFDALDLNSNGTISYKEFVKCMFGRNPIHVHSVKTATNTQSITTLRKRLRSKLVTKIKTLRGSPSKVFYQFRMLGGASGDEMSLEHFDQALLKWGIRAEQNVVYAVFQSLVNGAKMLTYEAFVTALMPGKVAPVAENSVKNYRQKVVTRQHGGVLKTLQTIIGQIVQGRKRFLQALRQSKANANKTEGLMVTFKCFRNACEQCNIHLTSADLKKAFAQLDPDANGTFPYDAFVQIMFGTKPSAYRAHVRTSNVVNTVTKTTVHVASTQQLRLEIIRKIKTLGNNPFEAFQQLRVLGGGDNNGMTLHHFAQAISKVGIHAEQSLLRSYFQSLVRGATLLTYEMFLTKLIGDDGGRISQLRIATGTRLKEFSREASPVSKVRRNARREIESKEEFMQSRQKTNANYRRRGGHRNQYDMAFKSHMQRQRNLSKSLKKFDSNRAVVHRLRV